MKDDQYKVECVSNVLIKNIKKRLDSTINTMNVNCQIENIYFYGDVLVSGDGSKEINVLIHLNHLSVNEKIEYQKDIFNKDNTFNDFLITKLESVLNNKDEIINKTIESKGIVVDFKIEVNSDLKVYSLLKSIDDFLSENKKLKSKKISKDSNSNKQLGFKFK